MKRSEVKKEFTWNLGDIFSTPDEFERELKALNTDMVGILKFKGKLNNKKDILECFKFETALSERFERFYLYAMLSRDLCGTDGKAASGMAKARNLFTNYSSMSSFVVPELTKLDTATLEGFAADPDFTDYDYRFSCLIRQKAHVLSESEERLLAMGGKTFSAFSDIFRNLESIDLPLPFVSHNGKREKLTQGKYSLYLQSKDAGLRKKAFKGFYSAVMQMINTLTAMYSSEVSKNNFLAKVRGYKSVLEQELSSSDVPPSVFDALLKSTSANLSYVHEYIALRKKVLNVQTLHMYDLYVPMFENADISRSYEKAYELVREGLKPLGSEYGQLLKDAYDNRWIDVEETDGKRTGAYSCGVYGVHPFVLLNYQQTTHDIFTIAHEMGHALHSYYSSKTQSYPKQDYQIFVAEVASTVNEVLLLKHLIKTEKDAGVRKYLLSYYLDMFRTTMFRQTMFAEFEHKAHAMDKAGTPLTVESLSKTYLSLNKKYYGRDVSHDKQIRYEWARIPHFYRAFYVYQYATGITSAVNIANAILTEGAPAVERYKKFLSAGGSKSPYEILKDCGVDLSESTPYNVAMDEFKSTLDQLKSLC